MLKVYYRLSNQEAGVSKIKMHGATKEHCLKNAIDVFGVDNITVIGDRLNDETRRNVELLGVRLVLVNNGNGAGTFRDALDIAIKENDDDTMVYLLEDDFLHLPQSSNKLVEVLERYDCYATLYDHPDKYIDASSGGNPFIEGGGEDTKLFKTPSSHWKITNSTVMSFAARVNRLKQDYDSLMKHSDGQITDSFKFFCELRSTKGIPVVSSIPGYSTHCETAWLSPLTNWEKV